MGSVPNVGLMAQAAEEYGSHDKTFEIAGDGAVRVVDAAGKVLLEHAVEAGDIWRMCQTKDAADPRLGEARGQPRPRHQRPAVFWLDEKRAHDAQVIAKVGALPEGPRHHRPGHPHHVARSRRRAFTLERIRDGPGHDLRHRQRAARLPHRPVPDHGARHQRQDAVDRAADGRRRPVRDRRRRLRAEARAAVLQENYLRWDSLGEFLALAASLEHLGADATGNAKAQVLAEDARPGQRQVPRERQVAARARSASIDNRGSHFYLALYWAQALAAQDTDAALKAAFVPLAAALQENEATIVGELIGVQGKPVDIGGYYHPELEKVRRAMRPSATFNAALAALARH